MFERPIDQTRAGLGSATSPGTVSTPGSAEEVMCREFATTA
jgi:hypothetical protein